MTAGPGRRRRPRGSSRRSRETASRVALTATDDGAVFLHEAVAWMECSIHEVVPAGDHDLVLLKVEAAHVEPGVPPLVFHASGFHSLAAPAAS
ncbi:flavin reductase family protein [Nonomuraea angiospora]|uniref:flavin reductase family protein n=1 Tax=Nonomuraea angiospora TaxID=46172 RepID=UPI0033C72818